MKRESAKKHELVAKLEKFKVDSAVQMSELDKEVSDLNVRLAEVGDAARHFREEKSLGITELEGQMPKVKEDENKLRGQALFLLKSVFADVQIFVSLVKL